MDGYLDVCFMIDAYVYILMDAMYILDVWSMFLCMMDDSRFWCMQCIFYVYDLCCMLMMDDTMFWYMQCMFYVYDLCCMCMMDNVLCDVMAMFKCIVLMWMIVKWTCMYNHIQKWIKLDIKIR